MQRAQVFRLLKSLELEFQRHPVYLLGSQLSKEDKIRVGYAYSLYVLVLFDMTEPERRMRVWSEANIRQAICWLQNQDLDILIGMFKSELSLIRTENSYEGYKYSSQVNWGIPYLNELKNNCYKGINYSLYNTALQFLLKLTLHDVEGLEIQALDKFVAVNEQRSPVLPTWLALAIKEELRSMLRGFSRLPVSYAHHSGGATAEVARNRGTTAKTYSMVVPYHLESVFALLDCSTGFPVYRPDTVSSSILHSFAYMHLVPKGIDSKRGITLEPTAIQYHALYLRDCFDKHFQANPWLKIDLHNQDLSRELALLGSRTREYSTIDLSSASDSIKLSLLDQIWPEEYRYILEVRSLGVLFDSYDYRLRYLKTDTFAGMGLATTFPVECLIFACLTRIALKLSGVPYSNYRVFGDDIIIDSRSAYLLINILEMCGFKVNTDKSFISSRFTEACGIECLDGVDVTPLRLPRGFDVAPLVQNLNYARTKKFKRAKISPEKYDQYISVLNRLFDYGCFTARRYLLADVMQVFPASVFCHYDGTNGIKSYNPTNDHLEHRKDCRTQTHEVRATVTRTTCGLGAEEVSYFEWLRYSDLYPDMALINKSRIKTGSSHLFLRKEWVQLD